MPRPRVPRRSARPRRDPDVEPGFAAAFRRLHAPGQLLVLPNAWDAASARLIESVGAAAIATTSSGVCWARGYPDGKALPLAVLLGARSRRSRA